MASVSMTISMKPTQQPSVTILVFLVAGGGFALLLPTGIAADPTTTDAVLAGLSSGACKDLLPAVDLRSCVDTTLRTVSPNAFTSIGNAGCCTQLGRECFCALLEKQGVLGISMPLACGTDTAMTMCSRKAGVGKQIQKELITCVKSDPTPANRKACENQVEQILRSVRRRRLICSHFIRQCLLEEGHALATHPKAQHRLLLWSIILVVHLLVVVSQ